MVSAVHLSHFLFSHLACLSFLPFLVLFFLLSPLCLLRPPLSCSIFLSIKCLGSLLSISRLLLIGITVLRARCQDKSVTLPPFLPAPSSTRHEWPYYSLIWTIGLFFLFLHLIDTILLRTTLFYFSSEYNPGISNYCSLIDSG